MKKFPAFVFGLLFAASLLPLQGCDDRGEVASDGSHAEFTYTFDGDCSVAIILPRDCHDMWRKFGQIRVS